MKIQYFKTITFIIFALTQTTYSYAEDLESCEEQATLYGSSSDDSSIDPECFKFFTENASANSIKLNNDETLQLVGYKNIIFIKDTNSALPSIKIYAGKNILVSSISAVSWDEDHNEIFVLNNRTGQIFAFSSIIDGNVSPLRELQSDLLIDANDFLIESDLNHIISINSKTSRMLFFNRIANIHGRKNNKNINLLKIADEINDSAASIKLDGLNQKVLIYNKENLLLSSFSLKINN